MFTSNQRRIIGNLAKDAIIAALVMFALLVLMGYFDEKEQREAVQAQAMKKVSAANEREAKALELATWCMNGNPILTMDDKDKRKVVGLTICQAAREIKL